MTYQVMPPLSQEDFEALKLDIGLRGVLVPVEYDEVGNILDGHHRVRACEALGISEWPRFIRKGLSEDEKRTHARQLNLARRHLDRAQKRELIASQLRETPEQSNRQIAGGLGVSHPTVADVRNQLESTGKIFQLDKTIGADGKERRKPIRTSFIDASPQGKKEALERAKEVRHETNSQRRDERLEKIAEISKGNVDLATDRKFPIIYADPPWRYENPPMGSSNRSIENHYPTMTLQEICDLPVAELATDDALLYLWATAPKLAESLHVVEAWGFEYRTNLVWDKEVFGMGYYARNQHELLLVCRRGNIPPPAVGTQPSSVLRERRGEHSTKPHFYYDMIEAAYPQLPKIELFCRMPREGWSTWGNQSNAA